MKCPTCGHTPATKRPKPIAVDVDSLDDAGRRAHYTRTAPYYDVQFMIDNGRGLSPELIADARALASMRFERLSVTPEIARVIVSVLAAGDKEQR